MKNLKDYINESILGDWNDVDADKIARELEVKSFLSEYYGLKDKEYKITQDVDGFYRVDVDGDVFLKKDSPSITLDCFEFGTIRGNFNITHNTNIVDLYGFPKKISGVVIIANCPNLKSLRGCPKKANWFECSRCSSLESLEGCPEEVTYDFHCTVCTSLKSLEYAPKKVGSDFDCSYCVSLTTLEGAPKTVGGDFDCSYCSSLESLEGAPRWVKNNFKCNSCTKLKNLKGCPERIKNRLYCMHCGDLDATTYTPKICKGIVTKSMFAS